MVDAGIHTLLLMVAGFALATSGSPQPGDSRTAGAILPPCPSSPNCVSSQATDPAHHVDPIPYRISGVEALIVLANTIQSRSRTHVVRKTQNYLHAEFTSLIFRFVDDVECVVDEASKTIQIRSASRVGYWDFGVNRRRVESLRRELAPRLQRRPIGKDNSESPVTPE